MKKEHDYNLFFNAESNPRRKKTRVTLYLGFYWNSSELQRIRKKHRGKTMPKEKSHHHKEKKEKEHKEERYREEKEEKPKKSAILLDISSDTGSNPSKMEEDNNHTLNQLFHEQVDEPALKHTRKDIDIADPTDKMVMDTNFRRPELKAEWRTFVSVNFDTQYPLNPAAVIIAADAAHAYQLMDQKLKELGRKTSAQQPYTISEISVFEPSAHILSMGELPTN